MRQIVPSIMAKSVAEFKRYSKKLSPYSKRFHVDVMDHKFVPTKGLPVEKTPMLPKKEHFEAHLMVYGGERHIRAMASHGFDTVLFSFEAFGSKKSLFDAIRNVKAHGMKAGIVLKPETEIFVLKPFVHEIDQVNLLPVHPGFYGMTFIPATLSRLKKLKRLRQDAGANFLIEVDGGIKKELIRKVVAAGAELVVVGSVIHESKNIKATMKELNKELM
jgi:ribulose-phosphate 3-epimerase